MRLEITQTTRLTTALPLSPDGAEAVARLKSDLLEVARCAQVLGELRGRLGKDSPRAFEIRDNFEGAIHGLLDVAMKLIGDAELPAGVRFEVELVEET
jgi:hypothetical protein